jgi:hypothetical protein
MISQGLPQYVDRGGELVYQQPYIARGTRQYLFFFKGERQRLAQMFDYYFNRPSGGAIDIQPATEVVVLTLAHIDAIRSADPPHSQLGSGIEEWEIAFWTVGFDRSRKSVVFCTPYIFVDSGMAMAAGREVFGFPKQDGWFTVQRNGNLPPERVTLDVLSTVRFDPAVPFRRHRLVELSHTGPLTGTPVHWTTYQDAIHGLTAAVAQALGRAEDLEFVAKTVAGRRAPIVFLKQFRDIAQPACACYQAITEAPVTITDFHGGGLLGNYNSTISDLESEPLLRELGMPSGTTRPLACAWIHYDFRLETGIELWRAP